MSNTARIVKGYVTGNRLPPEGVIELVSVVGEVLRSLNRPVSGLEAVRRPPGQAALPVGDHAPTEEEIKASIGETYLVSFEDGKPYHKLDWHLTRRGLTPEAYRAKWGLPDDYPMMPTFYRKKRADNALQVGLGYWDRTRGKNPPVEPDPRRLGKRRRRGRPAAP
ncbi:MucR family transcriptional regulator [Methylobacterium sp. CCH5-D2]|uniref:MucR family transcriptional regulator n=1 Tax=Methylobacterium sp. CCH5-D2 TaxID=1768765 RepID=UPI000A5F66BC|nr:MucR family transcriptional regulator [Methylobacterium sp. CCH5-D2]